MRKFINYLKESWTELTKKVTWPTWSKLQSSAVLVLVATCILAVVVFAMDFGIAFVHMRSGRDMGVYLMLKFPVHVNSTNAKHRNRGCP